VPTFFGWRHADVEYVVPRVVETEAQHAGELRDALLRAFELAGYDRGEREGHSLPELVAEANERLDAVPSRRRRRH